MTINKDYVKGFIALGVLAVAIAGFMAYPGNTGDELKEVAIINTVDMNEVEIASAVGDEPETRKATTTTNEVVKEKINAKAPVSGDGINVVGDDLVITVTKSSE